MKRVILAFALLLSASANADSPQINARVDQLLAAIQGVQIATVRNWDQSEDVMSAAVCEALNDVHPAVSELSVAVIRATLADDIARNTVATIETVDQETEAFCDSSVVIDPEYRLYNPADVMQALRRAGSLALTLKQGE
jgi:hypothetical protein